MNPTKNKECQYCQCPKVMTTFCKCQCHIEKECICLEDNKLTQAFCKKHKQENQKCKCACHDTEFNSAKLHSPVKHDYKCCDKMNGMIVHTQAKLPVSVKEEKPQPEKEENIGNGLCQVCKLKPATALMPAIDKPNQFCGDCFLKRFIISTNGFKPHPQATASLVNEDGSPLKEVWEEWIDVGINSFISIGEYGEEYLDEEDIMRCKNHLTRNYRQLLQSQRQKMVETIGKAKWERNKMPKNDDLYNEIANWNEAMDYAIELINKQ